MKLSGDKNCFYSLANTPFTVFEIQKIINRIQIYLSALILSKNK